MKRILFVDYMGHCLLNKPVGHSVKALSEYIELVKEQYEVGISAPESIIKNLCISKNINIIKLPFSIDVSEGVKSSHNKMKEIINLYKALMCRKNSEYDYVWFYNVDIYFFMLLCLINRRRYKIVCTMYRQDFPSQRHQKRNKYILEKAIKKISLVVHTTREFKSNCNSIFMPDYLYNEAKYGMYKCEKEEKAVCLGTVNASKNIEALIEAFRLNGYVLEIMGTFQDKSRYEVLKRNECENIKIVDAYLSDEEYYSALAKAKFAILPYNKNDYAKRTSGVLQESIFLNTIPVTYNSILIDNCVNGIGIDHIRDLCKINFRNIDVADYMLKNKKLVDENYDWTVNKIKLLQALAEI